jgi:hypothetical protein
MNPGIAVKFQTRNVPCALASPSPSAALFSEPKNRLVKIPSDAPSLTKIIHGGIVSFFRNGGFHGMNKMDFHFSAAFSHVPVVAVFHFETK